MKYNININQKALSGSGLDIVDGAILDFLITFCGSVSNKIQEQRDGTWTWIDYQTLLDDMPMLGIKDKSALSRRINKIRDAGFIETKQKRDGRLFVNLTKKVDELFFDRCSITTPVVEKSTDPLFNNNTPVVLKQPIIILDNNTNTNTSAKADTHPFKEGGKLPESRGKSYVLRVLSIYNTLWKEKYGFAPKINIGMFGKMLKPLMENYTELQIASMLLVFFNWHGMTGSDDFEYQKVLRATFNFGWFVKSTNNYEVYLRNVVGIKLDDEQEVRKFVAEGIHKLST